MKKIYHTNIDQFLHNLFMKYYSININVFYYYRQKYMNLKLVTLESDNTSIEIDTFR